MLIIVIFAKTKIYKMEALRRYARESFKTRDFFNEFKFFILLVITAKILAMIFSVFAGFFYFYDVFTPLFNSKIAAKVLSMSNLVLIEITTAILISKFFKFGIKGRLKTAIPLFIGVIGVFSVSFYSSTNGLALRQGRTVDNSAQIDSIYQVKKHDINQVFEQDLTRIEEQIATIRANPQGWEGKKRTKLLSGQLLQIDLYLKDIQRLKHSKREELKEALNEYLNSKNSNKSTVKAEASKYYNIVALVMCLIFILNGAIVFLFSKIAPEERIEEAIAVTYGQEAQEKAAKLLDNIIKNTFDRYFKALEQPTGNKTEPPVIKTIALPGKGERSCKHCGEVFSYSHPNEQFCSRDCRSNYWQSKQA